MPATFHIQKDYPIDRASLLELVTSPAFQEEKALDLGALEVRCSRAEDAEGRVVMKVFTRRPPLWGSKPDKSTLILRWDPATFSATWKHIQHGQEKRSKAGGTTHMVDLGGGRCRLETRGELSIRVPVVGPLIEKKVIQFIQAEQEAEAHYLLERAQRQVLRAAA